MFQSSILIQKQSEKNLKIKIPNNKVFYTSNILEDLKENMESRKFTEKEKNYSLRLSYL